MMEEIWRDIEISNGTYLVSNTGKVKTIPRTVCIGKYGSRVVGEKIRTGYLNEKTGYLYVFIAFNSIRKNVSVHRLVCTAFVPNPLNKTQVNHINGIKTDNRAENLEWATPYENKMHALNTGLIKSRRGIGTKHSKPIFQIDDSGIIVRKWDSIAQAKMAGFDKSGIYQSVKTGNKSHGYKWEFANGK